MKLKYRLRPYVQGIPKLFLYKFLCSMLLGLCSYGISSLSDILLSSANRVSVSSGDFGFVFMTWQGYLLIVCAVITVLLYISADVNALILFCDKLLNGEDPSMLRCLRDGVVKLKKYANPRGLFVILFLTLLTPLLGLSFSISLTESLYIPRFISSVIEGSPLYFSGLMIVYILIYLLGFAYRFIIHGAVIDGQNMKEAGVSSRKMIRRNLKSFIFEMLRFWLSLIVVFIIIAAVAFALFFVVNTFLADNELSLFLNLFLSLFFTISLGIFQMLSGPFYIMKLTVLYRTYQSEGEWQCKKRATKRRYTVVLAVCAMLAGCAFLSFVSAHFFDEIFPPSGDKEIVAHRAGGNEAPENTVSGIAAAYSLGAAGSEIDIQRTADGKYIINHDDTFKRVAGENKKPSEMTLEEIKKLRIKGEPVATFEEALDASRDKVKLFTELKGETADRQMADDAVRIIKEKGMENQTVLISLKYDILEYVEQKYPEIETGYLAFFSFGKIQNMPFDYLALEEEIATDEAIDAIHENNKKVMIWTVNDEDDIRSSILGEADMIITDEIRAAKKIEAKLKNRTPLQRILDYTGLSLGIY